MQVVIPILIVIALIMVCAAVIVMRRRSAATAEAPTPDAPVMAPTPEPIPMTDLESALAQVTDSDGRPFGDRIDAEADIVDDLRVPDDTGPLLRRALDNVVDPATDTAPGVDTGVAADNDNGTPGS